MKYTIALLALAFASVAMPAESQTQYTANITWTASTSAVGNPSLTYNLYRAQNCPARFTQINATPLTATSYTDATVAAGASYCYQVTAVLGGVESVPSNQALVAVPGGPASRQAACARGGALIGWIRCIAARPKKGT
jgi:fibronectin type 3 domain-containing protein